MDPQLFTTFSLLEAAVSLYPANADDSPRLSEPLWSGIWAENLRQTPVWEVKATRPTGRRHPRQHPLSLTWRIAAERLWVLPLDTAGAIAAEPSFGRGRMVLDIVWREEEGNRWYRRTYYGVTIAQQEHTQPFEASESTTFDAEYMVPESGTGTPPAPSAFSPLLVRYVNTDVAVDLFSFNGTAFAALADATGKLTLSYAPSGAGLSVTLVPTGATLTVGAAAGLSAGSLEVGAPKPMDVPRVEFRSGSNLVAAFLGTGRFTALGEFHELAVPAALPGAFNLQAGGAVVATLRADGVTAKKFMVT